jgi:oxygen-independent coproporphyrinogen-3 oxidase
MYVHIPYCRRRCNYCDFAIVPVGEGRTTRGDDGDGGVGGGGGGGGGGFADIDRRYRKAVLDEIDALGRSRRSSPSPSPSSSTPSSSSRGRLRSVYFGGGTPSLAPPTTLSAILDAIRHNFELDDDAEVTIEMDPGTFDVAYLESIRDMGFNRISLGVQSFDDSILETLGRVHRRSDVYRSVGMIGEVFGFECANYSIDLMSGVPGQTLAGWAETLREASCVLRPKPAHMSLYDLQVEEGTAFGRWYRDAVVGGGDRRVFGGGEGAVAPRPPSLSRPPLPSSEDTAFMYAYASGYLRCRGYEHYEISSYSKRRKRRDDDDDDDDERGGGGGRRRRRIGRKKEPENNNRGTHNQIYWEYDGRWHAVGLGATSNVDGMRYARPRAMSDYISWTEELGVAGDARATTTTGAATPPPPWMCGGTGVDDAEGHRRDVDDDDDDDDRLLDIVMTRLRTSEGLDLDRIACHDDYDVTHVEAILRGFELALDLKLGRRDAGSTSSYGGTHGSIRLNDPKGFLFSNHVISNIFMELSEMNSGRERRDPLRATLSCDAIAM